MLKHELHTQKPSRCLAVKPVKVIMVKNHPRNPLMLNAVEPGQTALVSSHMLLSRSCLEESLVNVSGIISVSSSLRGVCSKALTLIICSN